MKARLLLFVLLPVMAACLPACGGKTAWYKDGYNQADFNRDHQDCEIVADAAARRRTLTGRRPDPFAVDPALAQCLMNKGWSPLPPASRQAEGAPAQERKLAAVRDGNVAEGFGRTLRLPDGFILQRQSRQQIGPTVLESFLFQGPEDTYVNLIFQENLVTPFERVNYPLNEPFISYDVGQGEQGDELRWRSYFGRFQNSWIGAVGAYYLVDDRQRIVFVVTAALPEQEAPPPPGLHLSRSQNEVMSKFVSEWETWIQKEFVVESSPLDALKGLFTRGRLMISK